MTKTKAMEHTGAISKMITTPGTPVEYQLPVGDEFVAINPLLGKEISLTWKNEIRCINCGRVTKKSFAQGYCYPCFISIPETEECVLRPELCRAHEGIARDMVWATEHCLQDHFVYLALSSEVKVGVTRQSQIPTRWIDQGASQAIKLAKTPNRYTAGLIEVALKKHLTDKTNWRNMLLDKIAEGISLFEKKQQIGELLPAELTQYLCTDDTITEILYPSVSTPTKISSLDLEKLGTIQGTLTGIKGQYLIFDEGKVINVRKYGGYVVSFTY
ncbi:MAG: DUF2797 domain-containing protein [Bacteroidota bacterium]|nr:DUF2797 domain-containing protein [Bacteroidota bacterium]